jgi:hypothetical protein
VEELARLEPQNIHLLPNIDRFLKRITSSSRSGISTAQEHKDSITSGIIVDELVHIYERVKLPDIGLAHLHEDATTFGKHSVQVAELFQNNYLENVASGLLRKRFFRTGRDTLGVGHLSILAGDEIWFLHGTDAPVILRPLENGDYRFMGEAYFHGVMFGEASAECGMPESIMIE